MVNNNSRVQRVLIAYRTSVFWMFYLFDRDNNGPTIRIKMHNKKQFPIKSWIGGDYTRKQ